MRKYLYIYKSEIMSSLQYVGNIIINFFGYFVLIFIFFNLWDYIYSNPDELINGYSKSQMIWYVVLTEVFWKTLGGRTLCKKIVEDVKGGNIAYNINKPYSYLGYVLSSHLGEITVRGVIYSILGLLIGFMFLGSFPSLNFLQIIIVLLSSILAITISIFIVILIGLLSFKIEDAIPVYWLYSKFILILGTLFPIEFFPIQLQGILKYSPIYVVSYGPAKLFVNFNYTNAIYVLLAQILYLVITYLLCAFSYKKGVRKLNVNGG